ALPRGRAHRHRPLPAGVVAAAPGPFGGPAPRARGGRVRRAHRRIPRGRGAPVTLRTKLLLAQSPLVLALVASGVFGSLTTASLGRSAEQILQANYRSVLAAQRMKDAAWRMHDAAA